MPGCRDNPPTRAAADLPRFWRDGRSPGPNREPLSQGRTGEHLLRPLASFRPAHRRLDQGCWLLTDTTSPVMKVA
jgi:hypothetical protein